MRKVCDTFLGAWWCVRTTGTRSGFRMKTTVRSSTARSQQILKMTCLRFSLIKLKCENHTQMSVGQFGFWPYALLSGFYGIFYVFKRQFLVGGWACRENHSQAVFSSPTSNIYAWKTSLLIWAQSLLTSRSNQTGTVYWTRKCQVIQSLT